MSSDENIQIATPSVSIETIAKVTRGLFSMKRETDYKGLAGPVGLHQVTVRQGLSASEALGLANVPRRGMYVLTEAGEKFARLLGFGKEEDCRRLIAEQILESSSWSEIVSFLEINKGIPRDPLELVLHVEQRLGKRWKSRMRGKIASSYKSILEYANLIRLENNMILSLLTDEDGGMPEVDSRYDIHENITSRKTNQGYDSLVTTKIDKESYFQFSLPEFFIVMVKKKLSSIDYLKKQLKSDSIICSWLEEVEREMKREETE